MAKVDKTFVPLQDIHVTYMDEHGTPCMNPKMIADSTIEIHDRYMEKLSLLDHQFARLLEHYALELKEAAERNQPLQNYEYESYIQAFLVVLREYRLRVPAYTEYM